MYLLVTLGTHELSTDLASSSDKKKNIFKDYLTRDVMY